MTVHNSDPAAVPPPGCPAHAHRVPLHSPEFTADPGRIYRQLRQYGATAPIELAPQVPATLVTGYDAALEVLRNPSTFPKDPRRWQQRVPADSPVLPMMAYRPNCIYSDGAVHARFRAAVTDSLARVDVPDLRVHTEQTADLLIGQLAPAGRADLLAEYAAILPLLIFRYLFGCPSDIGDRVVRYTKGVFDGEGESANEALTLALVDLVGLKRKQPGDDVTSWLMAHPVGLTDEEMVHQLALLMAAGTEPEKNLIANGLRLLLSDDRFAGDLSGGNLPVEDALDEILWTDPPMANYSITYPVQDVDFAGVRLPADQPVVVSYAAANTDPALTSDHRAGNRAHLAWSTGPHACPAQDQARLIASVAIEKILDGLPDVELAVPVDRLEWRPGPFHRALVALPVTYPAAHEPARRLAPATAAARPAEPTPLPPTPPAAADRAGRRRSNPLLRWWRGE